MPFLSLFVRGVRGNGIVHCIVSIHLKSTDGRFLLNGSRRLFDKRNERLSRLAKENHFENKQGDRSHHDLPLESSQSEYRWVSTPGAKKGPILRKNT